MSGIYGMVRYDGAPVTRETLAPMAAAMAFWGPDGHGQWCGEGAGLGHLMLHVTPESLHERLPASIRVALHLVITADARIDNRDELFDALGVPGPGRSETPDSSLILLAYERWGSECVKRLLGDFAFAIWDCRERKLFCARDAMGCRPFVYYFDGKRFVFASDVKGVLARVESPRLNEPLLAAYLQMKTYHAEKRLTFFEGIVKLESGHTLTLTAKGNQIDRFWSPNDAPDVRLPSRDVDEQIRLLFEQSVKCRLRSAFPIASHLSGGLDSSCVSVVAARARREQGQRISVFSWVPAPREGDTAGAENEHARIEAVCRQEDLTCQHLPPTIGSFLDLFQRDFTRDPTDMTAWESNVLVAAESQGIRVMLSGWGGDEAISNTMACYLSEFLAKRNWADLLTATRKRLSEAGTGPSLRKLRKSGGVCYETLVPFLPDPLYSLASANTYLDHHASCIQPSFRSAHRPTFKALRGPAWRLFPEIRQSISHRLEYGHLHNRLESWIENGARRRIEYRYPMLDKRLIEFALGVPASEFVKNGGRRSLLISAAGNALPRRIDWSLAKRSPAALGNVKKMYFEAHSQWAEHLLSNTIAGQVNEFIDTKRIQSALGSLSSSSKIRAFSGIRQAFGCWGIRQM